MTLMNAIRRALLWITRWFSGAHKRQEILKLLREHGPMYGLDLVKRSNGRVSRGSVYVHLHRMEDDGWVVSEPGPGHDYHDDFGQRITLTPRRIYRISPDGILALWPPLSPYRD